MERVVQALCTVARDRLDSRVLAFNQGGDTVVETVDGVRVTRVGTWGSAGSVPVSPAFARHLRRAEADVMIVHEPNPWALLSYVAVRPRTPLGVWLHSDVVRPKLQYALFYAPIARPVYRDARRLIVSSPPLAAHATAVQPYRDRVAVIPFGIDADTWRPDAAVCERAGQIRREAAGPLVLFAGRHVPYKGVDVLIEAAATLDVTVVILGDGPMRQTWTRLAGGQTGSARFIFRGGVDDREMRAHLEACDMLVLPSVTRAEAFGYVQLEAMVRGKPVISTSLPTGVPWVNQHERTGLVVPPGDVDALRSSIRRLADDPALRARLGAAGDARVRQDFTLDAMGDRLAAVCAEIAGKDPC
jgi:rhamnosyl/mannosyltransferase